MNELLKTHNDIDAGKDYIKKLNAGTYNTYEKLIEDRLKLFKKHADKQLLGASIDVDTFRVVGHKVLGAISEALAEIDLGHNPKSPSKNKVHHDMSAAVVNNMLGYIIASASCAVLITRIKDGSDEHVEKSRQPHTSDSLMDIIKDTAFVSVFSNAFEATRGVCDALHTEVEAGFREMIDAVIKEVEARDNRRP